MYYTSETVNLQLLKETTVCQGKKRLDLFFLASPLLTFPENFFLAYFFLSPTS